MEKWLIILALHLCITLCAIELGTVRRQVSEQEVKIERLIQAQIEQEHVKPNY